MNLDKALNDPFLRGRLNPLLVQEIEKYALQAKTHPERDKIQRSLLLFLFRKLLQPLYLNYNLPENGTVFFLSTISSDGIGDFIALHKCALLFEKHCPEFTVKIGYTFQRKLPPLHNQLETYAFNDPDYLIEKIVEGSSLPDYQVELQAILKELEKNAQDYEVILAKSPVAAEAIAEYHHDLQDKAQKMQRGALLKEKGEQFYKELLASKAIVNVSLAFNTFENPLLAKKSLYFSEAGNFQGIGHAEQLNWYSMGLHPFEEGIFLRHEAQQESITSQYISYITTISNAKLSYIYLVCKLAASNEIEIILYPLTDAEIASIDFSYLQKIGIAHIQIDGDFKNTGLSSGKTLRLKQELPISYEDFIALMQTSQNPVGCTGDLSLSEALSCAKIPFYEMRTHKTETIDSLTSIAKYLSLDRLSAYFTILREIENMHPAEISDRLAEIIQSPFFEKQWQQLNVFINRYYCFEDSLIGTLKAFFAYQNFPEWKNKEVEIILSSQSAEEIYKEVSQKLKTAS